jgi:hypothetical protein
MKAIDWIHRHRLGLAVGAGCALLVAAGLMAWADHACSQAAQGRMFYTGPKEPLQLTAAP